MALSSPRSAYADPITPPQLDDPDDKRNRRQIAEAVRLILDGKLNCVKTVTLTANAGSTTVTDERIGPTSFLGLMPKTANAAGALATTYISARSDGSATITHTNNAQADKTFVMLILGQ